MKENFTNSAYESDWKAVQEEEGKGLPKSALKLIDKIKQKAKEENNPPQYIKAMIFRLKNLSQVEEEEFIKAINSTKIEALTAEEPTASFLHSMLAEMYWRYYELNRYRFLNRSKTVNIKLDDIRTWDLSKIAAECIKEYEASLKTKEDTEKVSLNLFKEIIYNGSNNNDLSPTLYDFLLHRALNFYRNSESSLPVPKDEFRIDRKTISEAGSRKRNLNQMLYFAEKEKFVQMEIITAHRESFDYRAAKLYQELLKFRMSRLNSPAEGEDSATSLMLADLERLHFVYLKTNDPSKESDYLAALEKLSAISDKSAGLASHKIAEYYMNQGRNFNPNFPEKWKWANRTADQICDKVIASYPNSYGAQNCSSLKEQLRVKELSVSMEGSVVSEKPFPAEIRYRNMEKVYWRIYKTSEKDITSVREEYEANNKKSIYKDYNRMLIDYFRKKKADYELTDSLPNDGDRHIHKTETKLPSLPTGEYLVIACSSPDANYEKNAVYASQVKSTRLSYIHRDGKDYKEFYILDRETGEPLEGVKASLVYWDYSSLRGKYVQEKGDSYKSDKNGYLEIPLHEKNYRQYFIKLKKENDELEIDNDNPFSYYSYPALFYKTQKYNYSPSAQTRTFFFTDRAIYRPGQTLHFKGLLVQTNNEKSEIVKNTEVYVQLMNANYQKAGELRLKTNEYGSYSGTFILPNDGLNGQFHIQETRYGGSQHFSVEDYKRPKFEVKIETPKDSFRLGSKITVKGKAQSYAGANIDGAKVQFRVVREARFTYWWRWWIPAPSSPQAEIVHGELQTDEKGEFKIEFDAVPDLSISKETDPVFDFRITADVTDINGETRTGTDRVTAGYSALRLGTNIPDSIAKDAKPQWKLETVNLSGVFTGAKGKLGLYKLSGPTSPVLDRKWEAPDTFIYTKEEWKKHFPELPYGTEHLVPNWPVESRITEDSFDTSKSQELKLENLEPGHYKLELAAKDSFGEEVKTQKFFQVFEPSYGKIPSPSFRFFQTVKSQAEPGEKVKFITGSSADIKALYEIEHKGEIIHSEWVDHGKIRKDKNSDQIPYEIAVKEEYRGNFAIHYTYVRSNRLFTRSETFIVPYTNKKLDISFETFRDKLLPGQEEEWRLKIKTGLGEKAAAEMLATLYDASLDSFRPNSFNFSLYNSMYASKHWQSIKAFDNALSHFLADNWNSYTGSAYLHYPSLNWFGYNFNFYYHYPYRRQRSRNGEIHPPSPSAEAPSMAREEKAMEMDDAPADMKKEAAKPVSTAAPAGAKMDARDKNVDRLIGGEGKIDNLNAQEEKIQVRSNFSETAFFYPHLRTNEEGELVIAFKIPESLTKWKMLGFAHTEDLKFGMTENTLITQKDLMVVPNAPRFFREGDTINFGVKINNLSEKDLTGNAELRLFDAVTMKPIDSLFRNTGPNKPGSGNSTIPAGAFSSKKGQSDSIEWTLKIPEGIGAIAYRITAKAGKFSDGEEMTVPVLTNRMLVTESMPLPIRGKTTKTFTMDKLLNSPAPGNYGKNDTLRHHRVTLEFTSNPAWYAVQALPYLMEYPYECIEQTFSRYYANSLSSHIVNSTPKIREVFEAWKSVPDSEKGALASNLEKNQELKSLLLEETPWVRDAVGESERKKRIGLLFDLNKMASELGRAYKKIKEQQLSDGPWSWFKGMGPDRYITQHIVTGLGHLDHLGVKKLSETSDGQDMIKRAVGYLDREIKKDYDELKRLAGLKKINLDDNHLGYLQIHYLYSRSYFLNLEIPKDTKPALDYYMGQAKKYWHNNRRYMQGMIALGLHRFKDKTAPEAILASLRENSIESEEMGIYWKEGWGYFWYEMPIESQSLLIEAFSEIANDEKFVDGMRTWLLKQKQTNDWKTTKATSEAIYALLLKGEDWLTTENQAEITMGSMKIDDAALKSVKTEAGTGYFKLSYGPDKILPEMGRVTVTRKKSGVSWGALYWQYFENLDKITEAETPLKLKKQLFLVKNSPTGKVITPIQNNEKVIVGDLVRVRIELRTDRTMEYVHMKDMRASSLEPVNVFSQYKYQDGLGYYESTRDAATNFFFGQLSKGTYVFEYDLRVTHKGEFSNGITTIQCMYAPEFTSHSEGVRIKVE
ncbi:MAG TPA: alpha-2-macroglobulin family protein [Leptospiraceae bacterium]|nr:alpha-2-macroglobulin family protein [Leptospiraceae bacterium]